MTYDTGKDKPLNGSGSAGSGTGPASVGDDNWDIGAIDVKGVLLEPQALDTYGVSGAKPKKKLTIDQQRKAFASQKDPVLKQVEATYLATMLYIDSGSQTGQAKTDMLKEARDALKEAVANAGPKVEELTLDLYARYELMNLNWADAEKAFSDYIAKFPKDKELEMFKAWLGYTQLKQFKNTEALASVQGNKTLEGKYVEAWAKLRTGDNAGAWAALKDCAKGWTTPAAIKDNTEREGVIRTEAIRFAARTGTTLADAQGFLSTLWPSQPGEQYELDKKLASSFKYAGRWTDAIAMDQKALDIGKTPPIEAVSIPLEQADFAMKLDDPATVEKYATAAVNALPGCGSACTAKDAENVVLTVSVQATGLHSTYAAANDPRYYEPAKNLYALTLPKIMDTERRRQIGDYQGALESTHKYMKPNTGRLAKDVVARTVNEHNQEIQACYEAVLTGNPKVGGAIVVTMDLEQSGAVKGVSTEPKAGAADLSAVAACIVDRQKTWKFPARGSAGGTRVKVTYNTAKR